MSDLPDSDADVPSEAMLPASAEAEWGRFARHLELMGDEGVIQNWLVFVFAYSPAVADAVRARVRAHFEEPGARRRRFVELPAETPTRLQNALPRLLGDDTEKVGCVWIQAVDDRGGGEGEARWREAWEQLLLGMNERRDAIRRHLKAGLVLAGPLWMKGLVQAAAPDLWSVRTLSLELPEEPVRDEAGQRELPFARDAQFKLGLQGDDAWNGLARELVARIERVVRLREPGADVEERKAPPPFDVVFLSRRKAGRIVDIGVVAVFDTNGVVGEVTPAVLEAFLRDVQAPLLRDSPLLRSTLVYGDPERPVPDALFEEAARHRVRLLGLSEYQAVVDFSRYLEWQSGRLERDPMYPPDLYVEQRAEVRVGVDRTTTEDVLSELHAALLESVPRLLLVLGDFGTGKTFLLRQLTRRMAADPGSPAPILIEMRDLQKSLSLDMLLAQHFVRQPEGRIPVDAFRYMLSEGKAVLLFDGFDELAFRLSYDSVMEHFETLVQAAEGSAKMVVTSRTAHFLNDRDVELALGREARKVAGYTLLKLAPFDPDRIHKALVKRLGGEEAAVERESLLARVEDLMGLSSNPRMLAFILDSFTPEELRQVGESHAKLTRSGVYERLVTRWLRGEAERAKPRGAEAPLTEGQLWKAVTDFALLLWPVTDKGLRLKDVPEALWQGLQALEPSKGHDTEETKLSVASRSLLVRDEEGRLSFLHQSILEWLVARDAAQELMQHGTAVMLTRRAMSPLMGDFLAEMGGPDRAVSWAQSALTGGGEGAKNAALLLQKLGRMAVSTSEGVHVRLDLSGQDLRGRDFSGSDYLKGADLSNARLDGTTLVRADLSDACLRGASLRAADARQALLRGADLSAADLRGVDLRKADLTGAQLVDADLSSARMLGAVVPEAALHAAALWLGVARPHEPRATAVAGARLMVPISAVSFSNDGRMLHVFNGVESRGGRTGWETRWSLPVCQAEIVPQQGVTNLGFGARAREGVARAADGSFVAMIKENELKILTLEGRGRTTHVARRLPGYRHAAAHPSRPLMALSSTDNVVQILDSRYLLQRTPQGVGQLLATLVATPSGWVAFAPDGRYKAHGDVRLCFWHEVNGVRFEAGELDDDLDAFDIPPRRVPMDEPLFEMPE